MQDPEPATSTAAFDVLTSQELFRQIVQWSAGWPGLVLHPTEGGATRPRVRRYGQFDRSNVAIDAARVPYLRELRILSAARWYSDGTLTRFQFTGIDNVIRRGDAEALRVVLETIRTCGPLSTSDELNFKYYYWSLAISHFDGRCDVLDVLRDTALLPSLADTKTTTWLAKADFMIEILHADVARWFVDNFSAWALPRNLVQIAGERGRRALFYYLLGVPGQAFELDQLVVGAERRRLLTLLVQCHGGGASACADEVLTLAMKLEDAELVRLILLDIALYCARDTLAKAKSFLETKVVYSVQWEMLQDDDEWDDSSEAAKTPSKGFRRWLRTHAEKVGRLFQGRKHR